MRKFILAIAALLSLTSAGYAAFAIFQTYSPRQQVSLSAYGSVCDSVTDDTAAFLAFKAEWQGTTPIQLNLPGNCTFLPTSGAGAQLFAGIQDLIVQGTGTATSSIKNIGANPFAFGGGGQGRNNSLPTDTVSAGSSCVTLKTAPSITISSAASNIAPMAVFTASASGTTLTVTSVASGTIAPGANIRRTADDARYFNVIQSYGTGGTTGVGGTGTYALSASLSAGSATFFSAPASFTASVDANGVMTVSAVADGTLTVGAGVFSADNKYGNTGGQNRGPTTIKSQLTGSAGSTGTYQLDNANPNGAAGSQAFHTAGQIRLTVNSTTGLTSGDTIFISGIAGTGALPNNTNGLKWIKVIDGTHIDLFQWTFDGAYSSGGTAGGDRTSLTPVGSKVMMTGYTLQSYWGAPYSFPTNHHWFEWKTVASVNSTTHQVCFDSPLVNTYKDTWPRYNTGSSTFEVDPGGPATLYPIESSWELTHVYKDFTLDNPDWQTGSGGRSVTWNNVAMVGLHCAIPSQNETYSWIGVDGATCNIETDKLVGTWNINNSTLNLVVVQSSSFDTINITNGSVIKQWSGGAKITNIDTTSFVCGGCASTTAGLTLGATAYGASSAATVTASSIANLIGLAGAVQRADDATHPWSMSSGVITIPNAYSYWGCCNASELQVRALVPGQYAVWAGSGGGGTTAQKGRVFKVVDVTQDLDNTYITTSEAGGLPTGAWTTNGLSVQPHPAPVLTASGNTGPAGVTAFNDCPAASPMFSCQNVTYTGGASGTTTGYFPILWGDPTTFTFTNNVPYTGAGSLTWTLAQFSNWQMLKTDLTTTTLPTETINTKLPSSCGSCTRTLTSSGATNTQASDSLTAWTAGAILGGASPSGPVFSANTPSDSPQITVTLRTNQNLP